MLFRPFFEAMTFSKVHAKYLSRQFKKIGGRPSGLHVRYLARQVRAEESNIWNFYLDTYLKLLAMTSKLTVELHDFQGYLFRDPKIDCGIRLFDITPKKMKKPDDYPNITWVRGEFEFEWDDAEKDVKPLKLGVFGKLQTFCQNSSFILVRGSVLSMVTIIGL